VDEQSEAIEVRRRRSRAEVEQLLAEYETSGLGRVEFCRRRGLSLSTLARYRKQQAQGDAGTGSRWLAVEVSGAVAGLESGASRANSGLALALSGGRRIEIGRDFDARTLTQLLSVLERI
jgi:hypothetical protein